MSDVTYPDVTVVLVGTDGNVFSVLWKVRKAIQKKYGEPAAKEFLHHATSLGSYDEVIGYVMQTVDVE